MSRKTFILRPACLFAAAAALLLLPAPSRAQQGSAERERGAGLLKRGDYREAVEALRDAVRKDPSDAEAWRLLGISLTHAGDQKGARNAFGRVVKLRPGVASAYTDIAYAMLLLNKPRDAEREAKRALKLDPNHAEARYVLGVLKLHAGKAEQALADADALSRLAPDFPGAAALAGEALLDLYAKQSARAADRFPMPDNPDEAASLPVFEKRDAALEPFAARMREAAGRLDAFASSRPDAPAADWWRELAETLRVYARPSGRPDPAGPFRQAQVTTKAVIIAKPEPGFTEEARQRNVNGVVRLRAVLSADGRVRHILVLKALPHGLTEKAVAAARGIRFTPAKIDGRPVSQFIVLEYNFNVY